MSSASASAPAHPQRVFGPSLIARGSAAFAGVFYLAPRKWTPRPNLVACFPPHVQLRLGTDVPFAIDTRNLDFFDEGTGASLR
jgi:hypothetical protein